MTPKSNHSKSLYARLLLSAPSARAALPALQYEDHVWTYEDLRHLVAAAARAFRARGLKEGERVLLLLPNSPEYVVSFLGVTAIGGIAVPVDFNSGQERLSFIARDTEPRFCLRSPERELPADLAIPQVTVTVESGARKIRLDPAAEAGPEAETELPAVAEDATAVILFSAGSTGLPKGAVLTHGQLMKIAGTLVDIIEMKPDHRDLILSPMTHSGGWQRVTATLRAGGCAVIASGGLSVPALLEDLRDRGIHGFFATPPVLRILMMSPEEKVRESTPHLLSIESASAPLSAAELERLMALLPGTRVYFQYGLTECSRAVILDARAHPDKLHTVGLPTSGVEVAISGPDGTLLGPGEKGEILLAAPQRTDRYWNRPDLNRERFRGRWLLTGDVGSLDEEGFLTYHGRQDDLINCGGLSFFPAEAEKELGAVGGVAQYLIAGVPDPQGILEQVPWAFVVPQDPETWTPRDFVAQARDRLPPHMIPRRVVVMPSMPLAGSGKPNRRKAIELYGPGARKEPTDGKR